MQNRQSIKGRFHFDPGHWYRLIWQGVIGKKEDQWESLCHEDTQEETAQEAKTGQEYLD